MTHNPLLAVLFVSLCAATMLAAADAPPSTKPATSAAEEAIRLTPPVAPTPRISGATVFGVRPGAPFLFTIAASGERPMTFAADHLPAGLALDEKTGQITGQLEDAGEFEVTFRASNAHGTARRPFKIVVGHALALTPHMGWNHWYTWFDRVTDKTIRDAADAMVDSGMANFGYQYVNIDDCWSIRTDAEDPQRRGEPRDAQGRINCNQHFPDMKALTDYIHAKGLKAGIYSSPGPLTCGKYEASYQHEETDVKQFAEWGFDFLKYDWCSYRRIVPEPTIEQRKAPYQLISGLLKKQSRDIVLNLCQYGHGDVWNWGKEVGGHSWRTAGDIGGNWKEVGMRMYKDVFDLYAARELHKFAGPGGWNDPDYLLIGQIGHGTRAIGPSPLTPNEQYTQVSFWAIVAAPLIFSGDMNKLDDFTLGLLCNAEVIDVNQDPLGKPGRRVAKEGEIEVWSRDLENGAKAVGIFNRGEQPAQGIVRWSDIGLTGQQKVRDLWRQKDLGAMDSQYESVVPRHGVVFIRVGEPVADQLLPDR